MNTPIPGHEMTAESAAPPPTTDVLRWNQLLASWPDEARQAITRASRMARYRRRTLIMSRESTSRELLAVVSGCIEVVAFNADGRRYLNALLGPCSIVPIVQLLDQCSRSYDYYAREDSLIVHIPRSALVLQLDRDPVLWKTVAQLAMERQRSSVAELRALTVGSTRRRIAAILLRMARIYAPDRSCASMGAETDAIDVNLAQHDLAAMLCVSRQTVNKELGALVEAGVLHMAYKRLTIIDGAQLERLAAAE
ncbi:MAG: Crp/Fnr family transcriptional regulator [Burkholderiaceae bacterium]